MPSVKGVTVLKASTPCFYECQPKGCLNPLCPYLHTKKRNPVPTITTPTIQNVPQPIAPAITTVSKPVTLPENVPQLVVAPKALVKNVLPPPPAPVHTLLPAIGTPTVINGVLTARGILGANPAHLQVGCNTYNCLKIIYLE
jgi:hypothetical protein